MRKFFLVLILLSVPLSTSALAHSGTDQEEKACTRDVQRFCRKLMDQAGDMRVVETSGPVFMMLGTATECTLPASSNSRLQQRDRTLPTVGANADDGAPAGRYGRNGLTQNACSCGSTLPLAALAQSAEIRSTPCSLLSGIFGSAAYRGQLALSAQKPTS